MPTRRGAPLTVCGKPLSHDDRKAWQQAIAMLIGLKVRNGFGEEELAAAVGMVLARSAHRGQRGASKKYCEDCWVTVTHDAAAS